MATLIRTSMAVLLLSWLSTASLQAEDKTDVETKTSGDQLKVEKKTDDGKKPELRDDHPERYTVVPGDTLWDISAKFLKSPWMWPKIWKVNTKTVKNPHLIYPGDIILLQWVGGDPVIDIVRAGGTRTGGSTTPGARAGGDDTPIIRHRPTTLRTDRNIASFA